MTRHRRKNPEAIVLDTLSEPVEEALEGMLVRMVNPAPARRHRGSGAKLQKLLIEGSQVLESLSVQDPYIRQDGDECWRKLEVAYDSGVRADQRTALTCLQHKLAAWTAEDADVAGNAFVQGYRKQLHLGLDH